MCMHECVSDNLPLNFIKKNWLNQMGNDFSETMKDISSHASQRITLRIFKRHISKHSQINT